MNTIQSVCVYSASSTKIADCYFRAARELGELLAHHGIRLVNGAGNLGLMRACADACLEAGGQVTGVIPRFMVEQGWQPPGLTELIETEDMHTRKQTMARLSDGVIALPGSNATGRPVAPFALPERQAVPAISRCAQLYLRVKRDRKQPAVIAPPGRPPMFAISAKLDSSCS